MEPIEVELHEFVDTVANTPMIDRIYELQNQMQEREVIEVMDPILEMLSSVSDKVIDKDRDHIETLKREVIEVMDPILEMLSSVSDKVIDKDRDHIETLKSDAKNYKLKIDMSRESIREYFNKAEEHMLLLQDRMYSYNRVKQDLKQLEAEYVCPLDKEPIEYAKIVNEAILSFYRGLGVNRDDVSIILDGRYLRYTASKTAHVRFSRDNAIFIPLIVKINYVTGNNELEISINPKFGYLHPHINSEVCWGDLQDMKNYCMRITNIVNMDMSTASDQLLDFGASLNTMLGFFNSSSPYFTYTDIMTYKLLNGPDSSIDTDVDNKEEFKKFISTTVDTEELLEIIPSDFLHTELDDSGMLEYLDTDSEEYYECDCSQDYGDYEDEHSEDCQSHVKIDSDTGPFNHAALNRILHNYSAAYGTNETTNEVTNEDTLF